MSSATFATTINCIDGRAHLPVRKWMQEKLDVQYIDRITEPGVDKILAESNAAAIEAIREKVSISVNAHHSRFITVVGHHDCAANPGEEAMHQQQIRHAAAIVASWGLPATVFGLWVNDQWQAELICQTETVDQSVKQLEP